LAGVLLLGIVSLYAWLRPKSPAWDYAPE